MNENELKGRSTTFRGQYLRRLPAVGKLMECPDLKRALETCPRVLVVGAINDVLVAHKARLLAAKDEDQIRKMNLSFEYIAAEAAALAFEKARMSLRRVINATGDVLNNDLGRTPLNEAAQRALQDVASGYSTLAVDIETGGPGDRDAHVQNLLVILTGVDSGLVVNNNAAAVVLILNTIADGKEVIVSRGQAIDNDGFRLPDIIRKSGAVMVSVGSTNKTHLRDYRDAIGESTGAILKVHKSNYRIVGFTEEPSIQELVELAKEYHIPVIYDMGSGFLVDLPQRRFPDEPSASLGVENSVDIVCFSGDKLLSGPQAGIVMGRADYISRMKKNPLYRVLRAGKLTMAALEATLRLYLNTDRLMELNPALRFLSRHREEIDSMTRVLVDSLGKKLSHLAAINVEDGYSCISSVSMPPERFPTKLISIRPHKVSVEMLGRRLRSRPVPVIVIVREEYILMDLRAVQVDELDEIVTALFDCCQVTVEPLSSPSRIDQL